MRVKAIVRYDGGATADAGLLMPLRPRSGCSASRASSTILVSNRGGRSRELTDEVVKLLAPVVAPLGLEIDNTKQDALDTADAVGAAFMSIFTTFGSFSIAAGILLIFLIFVMLAAERRGELGIARAVGTRRGHLVQMFLYEGVAYDLMAAVVGVAVGVAVAYGMVLVLASAFGSRATSHHLCGHAGSLAHRLRDRRAADARRRRRLGLAREPNEHRRPRSATCPSRRPEKARRRRWIARRRRRSLLGALLVVAGVSAKDAVVLGLGVSLVILSLVPVAACSASPSASRTPAPGSRSSSGSCCRSAAGSSAT